MKDTKQFLANLRRAVARGLRASAALAALTTVPARMAGVQNRYGTIDTGKSAHLIITDGDLFALRTRISEVWIDGNRYAVDPVPSNDVRGKWTITSSAFAEKADLFISGELNRLSGTWKTGDQEINLASVKLDSERISIVLPGDSLGINGAIRLSAPAAPEVMHGIGELPDGTILNWTAERIAPRGHPSDTSGIEHGGPALYPVLSPAMEYGIEEFPVQPEHLVIRNATIWTQGPEGVLEDADMLVSKGKIVRVGRGLQLPRQTIEIDGQGMHVTPGLIDAHIHTSISGGVNEVGNAITSEVRIRDVIDSKNIWIYRLLAGGLTSANLLHGSANPIGGQNAVLKMRWGALPSEMFIEDAPEGIKFALGENVKRSQNRYPNTRMGVEQIIRDEFHAAIDYRRAWRAWERDKSRISPRKDLRLEAIAEIIEGKRMIHAHCYRQDEILMLIRLMEEFDVRIRSFQHVVEGYKIAEALSEHGAGAAVWSDWWAFKVEAYDGTIYNARLLNDNGVLTVIHSDNTVIATRMNWEAGKTVGTGVSETDALNFVTLNPAKMLGIDHRVGSLEAGKDADFVIWNTNPLSPFSVAEQTWVDGRKYFDRELDARLQLEMQSRHAALIQKVLASKASGRSISGVGEKSESLNGSIYDEEYTCMEDHHEIH